MRHIRPISCLLLVDGSVICLHISLIFYGASILTYKHRWIILTLWIVTDINRVISSHLNKKWLFLHQFHFYSGIIMLTLGLVRIDLFWDRKENVFLACCNTVMIVPVLGVSLMYMFSPLCQSRASTNWKLYTGAVYLIMMCVLFISSFIYKTGHCWNELCAHPIGSWTMSYAPVAAIIAAVSPLVSSNRKHKTTRNHLVDNGKAMFIIYIRKTFTNNPYWT